MGIGKRAARKLFLLLGLDIRRHVPEKPQDPFKWLRDQCIGTVLDVGANSGQFAATIHSTLPEALIYSFEPLRDVYDSLVNNMRHVPRFRAFNFALGDTDGETLIHRSEYSLSSSLLPMGDLHKQAFPYTKGQTSEVVQVRRLDGILTGVECPENLLVKIDVQGFEDKVILGGEETLSRTKVVIVETSFKSLYEGQPLFATVYDMLRQRGFSYHGALDQLTSPLDGSVLQQDGIFLRETN